MIRIDLHLHSLHSKQNGDPIKWESLYNSILKLKNNNVKICSFSDHNVFDVEFYLEAKELAQTANILLLPAIEVNVVRTDGKIANIIYIFEENLDKNELDKIHLIANHNIPKRGISMDKVDKIFSEFETIKIPHVGKSDHFKYEDLLKIKFDAIEISNDLNKNFLNVMKKNIKTSIVAFSDTHKWNLYPEQRKLITEIDLVDEISFKELKKALSTNKNFAKKEIEW